MPIVIQGEAPNGGSHSSLSQEVTVDAATADGAYLSLDLGALSVARVQVTLLSADPDGEPYGAANGEIAFDTESIMASSDPNFPVTTPASLTAALTTGPVNWEQDNPYQYNGFAPVLPARTHAMFGITQRYIQIKVVIWNGFDEGGGYYAGANNPTATWRVDVDYF